jgi:hypothetical protein
MRRHYPLHIHISTLFLTLILLVCGVLGGIGYKLSSVCWPSPPPT